MDISGVLNLAGLTKVGSTDLPQREVLFKYSYSTKNERGSKAFFAKKKLKLTYTFFFNFNCPKNIKNPLWGKLGLKYVDP